MERAITGYHLDAAGEWVAELACGHNRHVRHQPPFHLHAWVLREEQRAARRGMPLACAHCDRAELPAGLRWIRTTPVWDRRTMPSGLRRAHRVAAGSWGRLVVEDGALRFTAATAPVIDVELRAGAGQAIPPGVEHRVEPLGEVRFSIEFFTVDRSPKRGAPADDGRDPACWAGLLCPECGVVVEGGHHLPRCPAAAGTPRPD